MMSKFYNAYLITVLVIMACNLNAQDRTIEEYISSATIHFTIDSAITDEGHSFFDSIFSDNHFIILGEYHGSSQIGHLTSQLIPIYAKHNGNILGLEIGPHASEIINERLRNEDAEEFLRELNSDYQVATINRVYTPIPFFSNIEDANFLQVAKLHNIATVGLDQENLYSYVMLIDALESEIPNSNDNLSEAIQNLRDTVSTYQQYEVEYINGHRSKDYRLTIRFNNSKFIQKVLSEISSFNEKTKSIVESLRTSNEIYYSHAVGDWWTSNRLRTKNFVDNFRSAFVDGHRIKDERLFLKVGGLHAAKGMNNYYRYDIGNLMFETARLMGKKSVHMVVLDRYQKDDEGIVNDILQDSTSWYAENFSQFLSAGRPDRWTIIDLSTIRKQGLYMEDVGDRVREYFERYDVVIIPSTDQNPTLNINK